MTPWEENRKANIAKNRALLESLGLDEPFFEPKQQKRPKKAPTRKRKASITEEDETSSKAAKPGVDNAAASEAAGGLRRSGRNAGKTVDYKKEVETRLPTPVSVSARASLGAADSDARKAGKRIHDPKVFGAILGVKVGTWWETREACSADAIHAPWVAGISGNSEQGAYSVCLSGGYEDDVDLGYGFTYTGSGGRDLKGTKNAPKNLRTAPQSSDQTFENSFNKALKVSSENGRPVRVVRGYKLKSKYAPIEGYRYDGLYKVEKAWMEPGLNEKGYLVCKFAFKRISGQPALEVRGIDDDEPEPTGRRRQKEGATHSTEDSEDEGESPDAESASSNGASDD